MWGAEESPTHLERVGGLPQWRGGWGAGGGGRRAGGQGRRKAQPEALQALAEVMQKTDEGAVVPETHATEA